MTEAWRNHYDRWKLAGPPEPEYDDDGEPIDPDELEAQREAAAEERAERAREDAMFDLDDAMERYLWDYTPERREEQ